MKITAKLSNRFNSHRITVNNGEIEKQLPITGKAKAYGSSVNGGELLMAALATCFCNDVYREALKQGIAITAVNVEVSGEFSAEGEAGTNFVYSAKLEGNASEEELSKLITYTDTVSEIQNTLRKGVAITLKK